MCTNKTKIISGVILLWLSISVVQISFLQVQAINLDFYRGIPPNLQLYDLKYNSNITIKNNIIYTNESNYILHWWWWDIEEYPLGGNLTTDSWGAGTVNFTCVVVNDENIPTILFDYNNSGMYYLLNPSRNYEPYPNSYTIEFENMTTKRFLNLTFGIYMYFSYYNGSYDNIVAQTIFQKIIWNPIFTDEDYNNYIAELKENNQYVGTIVVEIPTFVYIIVSGVGLFGLIFFIYWSTTCSNPDNLDSERCIKNRMKVNQETIENRVEIENIETRLFQD